MLTHDGAALPLRRGAKLAVVGPMGVQREGLLSDYHCDELLRRRLRLPDDGRRRRSPRRTPAATQAEGVEVFGERTAGGADALALLAAADVAILVVGIFQTVEHEGVDRDDTALPGQQEPFAQQVLALGKPTVMVMANGGALAIDALVDGPAAIVEAFNPSVTGPAALADLLFGNVNRWGKLPVTMYPHAYISEQNMTNYDMAKSPGRTYKYYEGAPLFAFGHGLSLTDFALDCAKDAGRASDDALVPDFTCAVGNVGAVDGDEVVFAYHAAGDDVARACGPPVPARARSSTFARVSVAAGASERVEFHLTSDALKLVDADGARVLYSAHSGMILARPRG